MGNRATALKNLKKARKTKAHKPKGAKNKVPYDLAKKIVAIEQDLATQGKGLADCAKEKPQWFYEHFLKQVIPKNIQIQGTITIEEILLKMAKERNGPGS